MYSTFAKEKLNIFKNTQCQTSENALNSYILSETKKWSFKKKIIWAKERFRKRRELYQVVIRSVSFLLPIIWNCFWVILKPDFFSIKSYFSYCHSALFPQDDSVSFFWKFHKTQHCRDLQFILFRIILLSSRTLTFSRHQSICQSI